MKILKNSKILLMALTLTLVISSNAFASVNNKVSCCGENHTSSQSVVLVKSNGDEVLADNIKIGNIVNTKAPICCEPNSPKTRIRIYEHYYYNSSRCDWKSTDYNRCDWCGALWYISATSLTSHKPGTGYYCPY